MRGLAQALRTLGKVFKLPDPQKAVLLRPVLLSIAEYAGPIRDAFAHSATQGCQTRHLARIFTVDFREAQELNSIRRVSSSANRVRVGSVSKKDLPQELR